MFGIEIAYLIAGAVVGFFANKFIEENRPRHRPRFPEPPPQSDRLSANFEEQQSGVNSPVIEPDIPEVIAQPTPEQVESEQAGFEQRSSGQISGDYFPVNATEELRELREQLKQTELAYRLAAEMSLFKSGFLARTSHELRSPLSSLIGLHQLIISDLCENPEEEREFIIEANNSALKLVKLLDEVVAIAKVDHGTAHLEMYPINLNTLLQEVYDLTHLQAENRSLRFQLSLPPENVFVMAEPKRLRQVLVNLIDRAITKMQLGKIHLAVAPRETSTEDTSPVMIWIDADSHPQDWVEPIDLLNSPLESSSDSAKNSPPKPRKISR
ncbi:MAG: HAMP domain-containing histidine kinase [Coleofasciculaceae cyanobacterium SM2_1_6]|nr:HAMP domain-containing histidine kinase [Coleofasciculaceae cyanobacterium SM2_1_6]